MNYIVLVRVVVYFFTCMVLTACALKLLISVTGLPKCELKKGIGVLSFSLLLFALQMGIWAFGDTLVSLDESFNFGIAVFSPITALAVLGFMLWYVHIVEKYIEE